jgi:hypothetical protein
MPNPNTFNETDEVEQALDGVDFREPIIGDESELINNNNDKYWNVLTESIRRAILTDKKVRKVATSFNIVPLSEVLPIQAISKLVEHDPRTSRLSKLMGKTVIRLLDLEQVPDDLLVPDIKKAPGIIRKKDEIDLLASMAKISPESFDDMLEDTLRRVESQPGISLAERDLVAKRYRYARDIKLLGLMAELYDQPFKSDDTESGIVSHELASGIKMAMTQKAFETTPALLNPAKWESRYQIKDRVYSVVIDGKEYIMKERKTSRHVDTLSGGHKDGLTSEQEFVAAQEFANLGTIRQGDIILHWEKPLGYVEFPDGYQFCLFESDPNLSENQLGYQSALHTLTKEIYDSPDEYKKEYEDFLIRTKEIYENRKDLLPISDNHRSRSFKLLHIAQHLRKPKKKDKESSELSYEDFAQLKAFHMFNSGQLLLNKTMLEQGYINNDNNGYSYSIKKDKRVSLEITAFDFEYYSKNYTKAKSILEINENELINGDTVRARSMMHGIAHEDRVLIRAASYAMLESMGYQIPPKKTSDN